MPFQLKACLPGQALIVTDIVMNHNIKTTTAIHRGDDIQGLRRQCRCL